MEKRDGWRGKAKGKGNKAISSLEVRNIEGSDDGKNGLLDTYIRKHECSKYTVGI